MKLTTVLASTNNNPHYYKFIPSQILFWKHFNIKFITVFVAESIPDELEEYKENIILWDKPTNYILHTAYIAQNIRIYYPALLNLPDNEMVMITDMDMLPTNEKYYKNGLEKFIKMDFIYYRHIDKPQIYMCYNASHPSVWSEIFNICSEKDIERELIKNYNKQYNGIPGSTAWYSDQEIMYNRLINYPHLKVLNRPLKRLEMHMYKQHLQNGDKEFLSLYDDAHFHRNYDSNKNYILNAKTQILSTLQIHNVPTNYIFNAVIITGNLRSFDKIIKSLIDSIIIPNNAIVFICCETEKKEDLYNILNAYPEINIGGIITEITFRNEEFHSILNMIKSSNRKGLMHEVFERAQKTDGTDWNINYIETSGSVIQYYQFWKIWNTLLQYERNNNCKFENIIRTRTDMFINKKINISNVFEEGGYIQNLYDNSLLEENKIYYDKLTKVINNPYDTVITLAIEQVWIGKRTVFDRLSNIIFHYGLWDSGHSFSFNSETNFHEFCKNYNIYHIGIQEKNYPVYFYNMKDSMNYLFGICKI